jgi:hypothetical protein
MVTKSPEELIQRLERRIQRLEDHNEVVKVYTKLQYLHSAGMEREALKLFALKSPDVSVEVAAGGVFVGAKSIKIAEGVSEGWSEDDPKSGTSLPPGTMHIHPLSSPYIEVAGDGKTAKGIWLSLGVECGSRGEKWSSYWAMVKEGVDFIKEDGKWKIWHCHAYPVFMADYYKSWIDTPPSTSLPRPPIPDDRKPDKPTTYLWEYSRDRVYENVPAPPEPYETWDGKSVA